MPRKHFTHLLEPSAELLASFLQSQPGRYVHLDFDVRVGLGRDPGPTYDSSMRQMAIHLSQRRIDCLGVSAGRIDVIEVTTQAGLTALGQLMAYPELYRKTYTATLPCFPVLVTYGFAPDMSDLYEMYNIECYIMPRPEPSNS